MPINRVGVMGDAESSMSTAAGGRRRWPNVMLCGTPGTGKSSLAAQLLARAAERMPGAPLCHIDLSKYAIDNQLVDGWDDVLNCAILDEDKVVDHLVPRLREGGLILDYHSCDFLPEQLIDLVAVLRTENPILYDRLKARNYPEGKISNNMACEIFQTILDEARDAFPEDSVMELQSNSPDDQAHNLQTLLAWLDDWRHKPATS